MTAFSISMSELAARCAACSKPLQGEYCSHCGEKRLDATDLTLRRLVEQVFSAFTHADGKSWLTLRTLLARPGRLTADFLLGKRKPYIPPLQVFLIANLVFFLLHPLIGSNTLTTSLHTQLHYTWHHAIAEYLVAPRLAQRGLTVEAYATIFDPAAITLAKSLVILTVPMFSLPVMLLFWRHRRHFTTHLVFSLHFGAFWLLLICATLALTNLVVRMLRYADVFPSDTAVSWSLILFPLGFMTVYLFRACRLVFDRESGWLTGTKALFLGLTFVLSLQAYRFALFFITFWST